MNKTVYALFFTLLFASLLVVPSIMAAVTDTYDISVLVNSSEEEEKHAKDFEIKPPILERIENRIFSNMTKLEKSYCKNYNSLTKELILPPPEFLF